MSQTKNLQSNDCIKKLAENAFKGSELREIKELKDGFFNVAYLLTFTDGKEVVLKIAPKQGADIMTYEKDIMSAEVYGMRLIKEKTTVPVPDVLFYSEDAPESLKVKQLDSPYFFMSKIEGITLNHLKETMTDQERYQIEYELGQYNSQMNHITGNAFGLFASPGGAHEDWKTVFLRIFESVIQDGVNRNVNIGMEYITLKNAVLEASHVLESVKEPRYVHWDLWEGNVFVKNGQIEGIIDFERAIWGDPLMEYAFRYHNNDQLKGFRDGYDKVERTKEVQMRCTLYDIYLYLIMTVECEYRQYPDDWQYNWAKNQLKEAVERLAQ